MLPGKPTILSRGTACMLAMGLMTVAAFPAIAKPVNFLFDAPGATATGAVAVNAQGWVVGNYSDAQHAWHGFLRTPDGIITTVDPAGARDSTVSSINDAGTIAGAYRDESFTPHIFTLSSEGTWSSFEIPGATDIFDAYINASGVLAGTYTDRSNKQYGYVRAVDGTIAQISFSTDTRVTAINAQGAVVGMVSNNFDSIAFVRAPDGNMTTFQIDGVSPTLASDINSAGTVVGLYEDSNDHLIAKGYVRAPDGTITTVTVPGASGQDCVAINDKGLVIGSSWRKSVNHETGFVRKRNGTLKRVAIVGYFINLSRINASGAIIGTAGGHALLRTP